MDDIKNLLMYNPETGLFKWKVRTGPRCKHGWFSGTTCPRGYKKIKVLNKNFFAHRLAFLLMTGEFPKYEVDHIDGNKLNNTWDNLRDVSHQVNTQNYKRKQLGSSGVQGVTWHTNINKWCAYISINGKPKHLLLTSDLNSAIIARKQAELQYYGKQS